MDIKIVVGLLIAILYSIFLARVASFIGSIFHFTEIFTGIVTLFKRLFYKLRGKRI